MLARSKLLLRLNNLSRAPQYRQAHYRYARSSLSRWNATAAARKSFSPLRTGSVPFPSLGKVSWWQQQRFLSQSGDESEELRWYDIDTPEYVELVSENQKRETAVVRLIDVREPEELAESGEIPGTTNIPRKKKSI